MADILQIKCHYFSPFISHDFVLLLLVSVSEGKNCQQLKANSQKLITVPDFLTFRRFDVSIFEQNAYP